MLFDLREFIVLDNKDIAIRKLEFINIEIIIETSKIKWSMMIVLSLKIVEYNKKSCKIEKVE